MKQKPKTISFEQLKKELLSNLKVKEAYDGLDAEYQIASQIIKARIKQKISQEDLAIKSGIAQTFISRVEGMSAQPSISLLRRISQALNIKINITIQ